MTTPTSLDQLVAGMQPPIWFDKGVGPTMVAGRKQSTWYLPGSPGPGVTDTVTANGVQITSPTAGAIPLPALSGSLENWLAMLTGWSATVAGGNILLCDRLLTCGANTSAAALSVTSTSAQTVNTDVTGIPSRDGLGGTAGYGVQCGLEVISAMGAGTPTLTIKYTNTVGTSNHTGTNIFPTAASSPIGTFYDFGLQAGDLGVRSVQSLQLSATMTSGAFALVLYRVLAVIPFVASYVPTSPQNIGTGMMTDLWPGTCPFVLLQPASTTASYIRGGMAVSQV